MTTCFALALLVTAGCSREKAKAGDAQAAPVASTVAAPARAPGTVAPPTSPRCKADDGTDRAFPRPNDAGTAPGAMKATLDEMNRRCGDSWCEGTYEIYFADLACRGETGPCDLTMRFYSTIHGDDSPARVAGIQRSEANFKGAIVGESIHTSCTPPCMGSATLGRCQAMDVRCTLTVGEVDARTGSATFDKAASACIDAMESALRKAPRAP